MVARHSVWWFVGLRALAVAERWTRAIDFLCDGDGELLIRESWNWFGVRWFVGSSVNTIIVAWRMSGRTPLRTLWQQCFRSKVINNTKTHQLHGWEWKWSLERSKMCKFANSWTNESRFCVQLVDEPFPFSSIEFIRQHMCIFHTLSDVPSSSAVDCRTQNIQTPQVRTINLQFIVCKRLRDTWKTPNRKKKIDLNTQLNTSNVDGGRETAH